MKFEVGSSKLETFSNFKLQTSNFKLQTSNGGRPVLVQELGCEPSSCRFNSDRSPFVAGRFRSAVRLSYGTAECAYYLCYGTAECAYYFMEDIRPDEGAVLKTAGVNTLRGSSPWSSAFIETKSPVA